MQTQKEELLSKTIAIRLTDEEYQVFDQICQALEETKSSYLRGLIKQLNDKLIDDLED